MTSDRNYICKGPEVGGVGPAQHNRGTGKKIGISGEVAKVADVD